MYFSCVSVVNDYWFKQFLLKHGCKSLEQGKMILQLKPETNEQYSDGLSQEIIDVKRLHVEVLLLNASLVY